MHGVRRGCDQSRPPIPSAAVYRFLVRPKWIAFHLLVAGAIILMVNLAFWQLRRLDERRQFNSEVRSRSELSVVDVAVLVDGDVLVGGAAPNEIEWRRVTATGTYLTEESVTIVNRSQNGQAGADVLTPLELSDGSLVLVDRGFVPGAVTMPPPPAGTVVVLGRVRRSQDRSLGQLTDPAEGDLTEAQRIDIARLSPQMPGPVAPVYLDLTTSDPAEGDFPLPVPDPELSEGPHLSYTVQWFVFSVSVFVGWVLAVQRSATKYERERLKAATAATVATAGDHPTPADDAPTTMPI